MGLCLVRMKPRRGGRCRGRIRPPAPSLPHPPPHRPPLLPPCSLLENTKLRLGLSSFPYGERCKPVQCMAGHFVHNFTASGSKTRWGNPLFSSSHLVRARRDRATRDPGANKAASPRPQPQPWAGSGHPGFSWCFFWGRTPPWLSHLGAKCQRRGRRFSMRGGIAVTTSRDAAALRTLWLHPSPAHTQAPLCPVSPPTK